MAGLGRKVFGAETLSSAEVQGYLMDQAVMAFGSAAAREAAIPAPTESMMADLQDTNQTMVYRAGVGWVNIGNVAPAALTLTSAAANFSDGSTGGIQIARIWAQGRTIHTSGLVKLTAGVAAASETSVATVASGWRPKSRECFPVTIGTAAGRLDFYANGDVKLVTGTALAINSTFPLVGAWSLD